MPQDFRLSFGSLGELTLHYINCVFEILILYFKMN
jgi:hypothetical protein